MRARPGALAVLILTLLSASCGSPRSESGGDSPSGPESVRLMTPAEILQRRAAIDERFHSDRGPLTDQQRATFRGLEYYPPSPAFQFVVPLMRYREPETVLMPFTGGDGDHESLRWGYFAFEAGGVRSQLHVYRPLRDGELADYLFVPFRDATSGVETYGGGRYLEIPYNPGGWYALDFNLAFTPYCAHNPSWSCPSTPRDNTLEAAIRAGERGHAHAVLPGGGPDASREES